MKRHKPFSGASFAVLCTCPDENTASRIAHSIVEERLAACANILPGVRSVYRWKGQVESEQEVLLIIKTTPERFPALSDRIVALHPYETPEVIALPIVEGLEKYLTWLRAQVELDSSHA